MAGWTNRGKYMHLKRVFDGTALPTNYGLALVTSATAPSPETNTMADLTEITGGGYARKSLAKNTTNFVASEADGADDYGQAQVADQTWTASGGSLPTTGGARYMVLTDGAAGTSAEVYHYWDLGSDRQVSDGQNLNVNAAKIQVTE